MKRTVTLLLGLSLMASAGGCYWGWPFYAPPAGYNSYYGGYGGYGGGACPGGNCAPYQQGTPAQPQSMYYGPQGGIQQTAPAGPVTVAPPHTQMASPPLEALPTY